MKNKTKIKILKMVQRWLEKEWGFCEFQGKKIHYSNLYCGACNSGLVYSFIDRWILYLDEEYKDFIRNG